MADRVDELARQLLTILGLGESGAFQKAEVDIIATALREHAREERARAIEEWHARFESILGVLKETLFDDVPKVKAELRAHVIEECATAARDAWRGRPAVNPDACTIAANAVLELKGNPNG